MITKQRRRRRQSTPKPVTLPEPPALGLTDQQKVERLPRFGPGLRIRVPLHLWPIYRRVYGLVELPPQLPRHERINQSALMVQRVPKTKAEAASMLWRCLECLGQPELLQPDMIKHMQDVHQIDTANATGTKNLVMRTDASGVYRPTFEYIIDGMTFLRYEPPESKA